MTEEKGLDHDPKALTFLMLGEPPHSSAESPRPNILPGRTKVMDDGGDGVHAYAVVIVVVVYFSSPEFQQGHNPVNCRKGNLDAAGRGPIVPGRRRGKAAVVQGDGGGLTFRESVTVIAVQPDEPVQRDCHLTSTQEGRFVSQVQLLAAVGRGGRSAQDGISYLSGEIKTTPY